MRTLLIFTMLFLGAFQLVAQKIEQVSFAATSEAIGLPFTNYSPYHPGLEVGLTPFRKEKEGSYQLLGAKLGFFYHRRLETAIYLGPEYQYSKKLFGQRISLDFPMGLGYLHSFYPGELYEQTDDGNFEKVTQLGRAHFYANLGIGVSYLNQGNLQPFIRQEMLLETPFANGIPVIFHSILKLGVTLKIKDHEDN